MQSGLPLPRMKGQCESDMTSIIPFSGLIIDILAIAAFVRSFGQPLMWLVGAAWILSSWATNGLAQHVREYGIYAEAKGPMFIAGAFQDIQCAVALYTLFWH
jgi:hypothetical protein